VSSNEGRTWSQPLTIGAPWWNIASAPVMGYFFNEWWIGDYSQVVEVPGRGFATNTIQGKPLASGAPAPEITGFQSAIVAQIAVRGGGDPHATRVRSRRHHLR
jgi:hypothetical protein